MSIELHYWCYLWIFMCCCLCFNVCLLAVFLFNDTLWCTIHLYFYSRDKLLMQVRCIFCATWNNILCAINTKNVLRMTCKPYLHNFNNIYCHLSCLHRSWTEFHHTHSSYGCYWTATFMLMNLQYFQSTASGCRLSLLISDHSPKYT